VTVIAGDPGSGKSYLTHYIAAQITLGTVWPDCSTGPKIKGSVIFFADEDDRSKVIRPRLDAHGADVSKIHILDKVFSGDEREFFDIGRHLDGIDQALKRIADVRLAVFDPITAYLGKTNANSNAEVRAVLTPLAALAVKHNVTIIGINHLNKRTDLSYMYRGLGSQAFVAQARSAWAVILDPDDRETRMFAPIKSNYCIEPTGLKFRIVDGVVVFENDPWTGHVDDTGGEKKSRVDQTAD
jgi:putative DNA primase/helicase